MNEADRYQRQALARVYALILSWEFADKENEETAEIQEQTDTINGLVFTENQALETPRVAGD
jgi:hypothetical protein